VVHALVVFRQQQLAKQVDVSFPSGEKLSHDLCLGVGAGRVADALAQLNKLPELGLLLHLFFQVCLH
jgi:hypothetical protein